MRRHVLLLTLLFACGDALPTGGDSGADAAADVTSAVDGSADANDATTNPCGANEVFCSGTCYPNDIDHCGPTCVKCGAPSLGKATCDGTKCGFTCTYLQCGSTCVDPSTDQSNCGSCGHDCLGLTCSGSQCQPANVCSNGSDFPTSVVVDATNVYWADLFDKTVKRCPKGGGSATTVGNLATRSLAIDNTSVYYADSTAAQVDVIALDGGAASTIPTPDLQSVNVLNIALSQGVLYVGDTYGNEHLYAVPIDGGAAAAVANVPGMRYVGVANGAVYLAWADVNASTGWLGVTSGDGGPNPFFFTDGGAINTFVADNANAYVGATDLFQVPLDGGASAKIAKVGGYVLSTALDGNYVYWGTQTSGGAGLYRMKIGTSNIDTLVFYSTPNALVDGIAFDASYVYFGVWAGSSTNGVYRTAK